MKLYYFLSPQGTLRNIYLSVEDFSRNIHYKFQTSLRISEKEWDEEKQRPKNIYLKKYKRINHKLDALRIGLSEYLDKKRKQKKTTDPRYLSKLVNKICIEKEIMYPENSLMYYIQQYSNNRKPLICTSTYRRYQVFFHLLSRFEGYMLKRYYVESLGSDFISDFIRFGQEEHYSEGTIYRSIHFVKTILNFAERKGVRTCVKELELRKEKRNKEVITLNEEELYIIRETQVPEKLQDAKDWLMISCYTGQRFSDFMKFNIEKMIDVDGKKCLSFVQQKTQKQVLLPLHPVVTDILRDNNYSFPKRMNMHNYNKAIKEIALLSGIREVIKARKRQGYRSTNIKAEKWQWMVSHIGRRSFATNFYGKIPTSLLMEATGHSTEQMFMRYISAFNKDRAINLSRHFSRVYEARRAG